MPYEEGEENTSNDISPAEQKARESGWRPQDDWDGDPDDWVDYKEFNYRGELMGRISKQGKAMERQREENDTLKQAIQKLGEHNKQIREHFYQQAVDELERKRSEAISEGDSSGVRDIESRLVEINEAKKKVDQDHEPLNFDAVKQQRMQDMVVAYQNWIAKPEHQWHKDDPILRGAANEIARPLFEEGASPEEVLEYMDQEIKKAFPDKFTKNQRKVSQVDDPDTRNPIKNASSRGKSKYTSKDLTRAELRIAKTFVENGVYKNVQEYVDQYAELGGFEGERYEDDAS